MRVSIDRLRRIIKEEARRALGSRNLSEATRNPYHLEDDLLKMDSGTLELTVTDLDGQEYEATVEKGRGEDDEDYYTLTIDGEGVAGGPGVGAITDYLRDQHMGFYY